jgi:hypothetical protein
LDIHIFLRGHLTFREKVRTTATSNSVYWMRKRAFEPTVWVQIIAAHFANYGSSGNLPFWVSVLYVDEYEDSFKLVAARKIKLWS